MENLLIFKSNEFKFTRSIIIKKNNKSYIPINIKTKNQNKISTLEIKVTDDLFECSETISIEVPIIFDCKKKLNSKKKQVIKLPEKISKNETEDLKIMLEMGLKELNN